MAKANAAENYSINKAQAKLGFVTQALGYIKTYVVAEADAHYDCQEAVLTEKAAYWVLETSAYAGAMGAMAGANGTPWAQYRADVA